MNHPRAPQIAFFAVVLVLGLATLSDVPATDDARFYVPASQSYARWVTDVLTEPTSALTREAIDRAFRKNSEHPPVAKYVMGLGWLIFGEGLGLEPLTACRIPIVVLWAFMCTALLAVVKEHAGWLAAIVAGGGLALMPRVFFHAHAETLDLPVTAFITFATLSTFKCLREPSARRVATATAWFALALGTKLNAPFALAGLWAFGLLLYGSSPLRKKSHLTRLPAIPLVLVTQAAIAPLMVFAMWPWLWFDTVARLRDYTTFHLQHYSIYFYYGGALYGDAETVAPFWAPWIMVGLTTPIVLLLLSLTGLASTTVPVLARLPFHGTPGLGPLALLRDDAKHALAVLAVIQAAVLTGALSLPGVPLYGGVKLLLPALPFIAILAGVGLERVLDGVNSPQIRYATAAIVLLTAAVGLIQYRGGLWLSYHNELVGGVRGATGLERQYYDLAYPQLRRDLTEALPSGGTVAVLPNPKEYRAHFARWHRDGSLPQGVRMSPPAQADIVVLTHEKRWPHYWKLVRDYRRRTVRARYAVHGVPLYTLYSR